MFTTFFPFFAGKSGWRIEGTIIFLHKNPHKNPWFAKRFARSDLIWMRMLSMCVSKMCDCYRDYNISNNCHGNTGFMKSKVVIDFYWTWWLLKEPLFYSPRCMLLVEGVIERKWQEFPSDSQNRNLTAKTAKFLSASPLDTSNHGYIHLTVNHSKNFVDPFTGVHTNTVEGLWSAVKRKLKRMNGTRYDRIPEYLDEFMWKRQFNQGDRFLAIIQDIAAGY